jgi:hypothetical protein
MDFQEMLSMGNQTDALDRVVWRRELEAAAQVTRLAFVHPARGWHKPIPMTVEMLQPTS